MVAAPSRPCRAWISAAAALCRGYGSATDTGQRALRGQGSEAAQPRPVRDDLHLPYRDAPLRSRRVGGDGG